MKNNRGFTLVEVMVVLAIMAVLTGMIGLSISMLTSQRLKSAVSDTKSLMQSAQTVAMSKDNCTVTFEQDGEGKCIVTSRSGSDKQLKEVEINSKISVVVTAGGVAYTVGGGTTVKIQYNRETGGFKECLVNGSAQGIPTEISFTQGDRTIVLELATYTGKISTK